MVCLALFAASSASLASDTPFDLAGLSAFGFPSALIQPPLSGIPTGYLQPSMPDLDAIYSLAGTFMAFPGSSSFGFPATPSFSSPSFSATQMGFPDISDLVGQSFQDSASPVYSEPAPSAGAYTEANNGQAINIKLGDTVRVQLTSQLDLGYIWNLSVTDGLNITASRVYLPQQLAGDLIAGRVDLLSTQEWTIKAIKPGTQVINATYGQSAPGPGDRTFLLTVIVE